MRVRASVKRLLGRSLFTAHLDALLLRNAAVVVAFHRIQETDGSDSLTTDAGTFERYCRFFARHFRVVSLRNLVLKLEHGIRVDHHLAITFDDGYRDNFENALPVLEKLSLPATFFVVSDWIGTDVVPWWDRERGVRHPWMRWGEVRSLHRKGFEIGAHTRTHVDLGKVSPDLAREEILGARLDLERQIGARVESFAYPYGGRNHLTDPNRELVKAAGLRCCCSGFGGINVTGTDPFFLRRVPISPWYASPHQFGFDVALGRSVNSV
jgi:peptidoglycan/xylan/chitin deacetylase (PgdA/CDA1 family)